MIVLGNKRRHWLFLGLLCIFFLFLPVNLLSCIRLSIDSIFSGLLALTGFVFTARTFITFKLHETIYGNPRYQSYVERLSKDGAYNRELYDPLKELDTNLGDTTGMCLIALALFGVVSVLPEYKYVDIGGNIKVTNAVGILFSKPNLIYVLQNPSSLSPFPIAAFIDAAVIYFSFVLWQIYITASSLNRNIRAIIAHWEKEYSDDQKGK